MWWGRKGGRGSGKGGCRGTEDGFTQIHDERETSGVPTCIEQLRNVAPYTRHTAEELIFVNAEHELVVVFRVHLLNALLQTYNVQNMVDAEDDLLRVQLENVTPR